MSRPWSRPTWMVWGLLVLAACTGGSDASSPVTPDVVDQAVDDTSPASTTTPTAAPPSTVVSSTSPSTTESSGARSTVVEAAEGFRSPTGNIHCRLSPDGVRCSHHGETPWKAGGALPRWAEGVSFGFTEIGCVDGGFVGFDVAAAGRPKATCGHNLYTAPEETLAYGERRAVGDVSCVSQSFGMTCLNADGHGFRMATNEIAMLYDRPAGWEATSSSTADDRLVPSGTSTLEEPTKISNESGAVGCYLVSYPWVEPEVAVAECAPSDHDGSSGVDWSPDGRSCAGADFHGYYLDDDVRAGSRRIATFGCTTDMSPLADPRVLPRPMVERDAVTIGGITCLSTGPAIACFNRDGNGMLTAADEVSFFYDRNT
ncbi:MAG: hypothetical protein ACR2P0_06775 [Acidimicrobiales bacterium]